MQSRKWASRALTGLRRPVQVDGRFFLGSEQEGQCGCRCAVSAGWDGEAPAGVNEVIRSETEFVLPAYRTQLFNSGDIDNVKKIQAGY